MKSSKRTAMEQLERKSSWLGMGGDQTWGGWLKFLKPYSHCCMGFGKFLDLYTTKILPALESLFYYSQVTSFGCRYICELIELLKMGFVSLAWRVTVTVAKKSGLQYISYCPSCSMKTYQLWKPLDVLSTPEVVQLIRRSHQKKHMYMNIVGCVNGWVTSGWRPAGAQS